MFADNDWVQHTKQLGQTMSYCGVEAHFQNGIAEKTIRDLQDQAWTMILNAQHLWPDAINQHLWPYTIRLTKTNRNPSPREEGKSSPTELVSGIKVQNNLQNFHPFGCPVYTYIPGTPEWSPRARQGFILGLSPIHAKSIALVLNLETC